MTSVDFHPEAEAELLAAARYYEEQAQNLGLDFLDAVEATCDRILEFPDIGREFGDRPQLALRRTVTSLASRPLRRAFTASKS